MQHTNSVLMLAYAFPEWVHQQPRDKTYEFMYVGDCAVGQYLRVGDMLQDPYIRTGVLEATHREPMNLCGVLKAHRTFGDLSDALKEKGL